MTPPRSMSYHDCGSWRERRGLFGSTPGP